jgi:hypothetical protein
VSPKNAVCRMGVVAPQAGLELRLTGGKRNVSCPLRSLPEVAGLSTPLIENGPTLAFALCRTLRRTAGIWHPKGKKRMPITLVSGAIIPAAEAELGIVASLMASFGVRRRASSTRHPNGDISNKR